MNWIKTIGIFVKGLFAFMNNPERWDFKNKKFDRNDEEKAEVRKQKNRKKAERQERKADKQEKKTDKKK